jgi:NAD+ synthase (glutamine-hydrolysing)
MAGAEVIVNINASPYRCGKHDQRYRMVATRATDELSYVCYLNMIGGQDELVFEGASMIFDPEGRSVVQGTFFEEDFLVADLDIDAVFSARLHDTRRRQSSWPARVPTNPPGRMVETPLSAPRDGSVLSPLPPHYCSVPNHLAEIYGALVLGTRDYVHKSGFQGVVVGLSGGIDSALTATIAVDALGPDRVVGVSMPSRYSSEGSRSDAAQLAHNLGIRYLTIPIEQPFGAYLETLAEAFADTRPDITEENLQARIRGNLLMALSNKFGWLVLTTGNKSEMAVGYSTLYGDLAGGFSVLKDVYKTTVFELAEHRNETAGREVIPRAIIEKEPSAELRPEQRDVDSLPPYHVLDGILRLYVEQDRSSTDIVAHGYDPTTVTRVINLVEHSEYKRRQAPPGVKITTRAFGKDRRLPIVNHYRDLPETEEKEAMEAVAEQAQAEVHGGFH